MTRNEFESFRRWKKRRAERRAAKRKADDPSIAPPESPPHREQEQQPQIQQETVPMQQQPQPGPPDNSPPGLSMDTIEKMTFRETKWMTAVLSRLVPQQMPSSTQLEPSLPNPIQPPMLHTSQQTNLNQGAPPTTPKRQEQGSKKTAPAANWRPGSKSKNRSKSCSPQIIRKYTKKGGGSTPTDHATFRPKKPEGGAHSRSRSHSRSQKTNVPSPNKFRKPNVEWRSLPWMSRSQKYRLEEEMDMDIFSDTQPPRADHTRMDRRRRDESIHPYGRRKPPKVSRSPDRYGKAKGEALSPMRPSRSRSPSARKPYRNCPAVSKAPPPKLAPSKKHHMIVEGGRKGARQEPVMSSTKGHQKRSEGKGTKNRVGKCEDFQWEHPQQ